MNNLLRFAVIPGLVIWSFAASAQMPPPAEPVSVAPASAMTNSVRVTAEYLTQLSEQMRTNHPLLRAGSHRTAAAEANARSVRTWEDPMAKIGVMGGRTMMRADDGDLIYGVEQKLPLFGKPQAERRMAQAEASVQETKVDLDFQMLRRDLAKAVFRAGLAHRTAQLDHQELAWLDTLVDTVQARYENGTATLAELLQVQNERGRRGNVLRVNEAQLAHENVSVNRFLTQDTATPLPRFELPAPTTPIRFNERLMKLALTAEPKLHVMRRELDTARASVDAARRQRLPDFALGAEGRTYSRNGDLRSAEVMLSFNIPWGNRRKYGEQVKREREKVRATELEIENEANALREEVHQLTIMIENARREALLYRDEIIPRSRTGLEAAHTAWMSGTGMLREVLDARRMLIESELMYSRAVSEQYQALSELVLCCGLGDFEALQMIGLKEVPTLELKP